MQTIAHTIYEQLGGRQFAFMTGARNLTSTPTGLLFSLPGTMTRNRINRVKIDLTPDDEYNVEFSSFRAGKVKVISTHEGVYCDMLAELVREKTGLETRMPNIVFAR